MSHNSWVGGGTGIGLWDLGGNWSAGTVPGAGDDVTINENGRYSVLIQASDPAYAVSSLTLGGGGDARVTDQGTLSVTGATTMGGNSSLIVTSGATAGLSDLVLSGAATILDQGSLDIGGQLSGGGTFLVSGGELSTGAVSGADTFQLTNAGTLTATDSLLSQGSIVFGDQTADRLNLRVASPSYNAPITGFGGSSTIDIQSLPYAPSYTYVYTGSSIIINDGPSTVFALTNINNPGSLSFQDDGSGGTELTVCFARGTRILTPSGEVAVEDLAEGDSVVTLAGGAQVPQPVAWIGRRRIDLAAHPRPQLAAPVRIRRDAFGAGLPRRDLVVSPDHCLFVDGRLIPAKALVNDMTIVQERHLRHVDYHHVELRRHAVLLAEGLPAESYLDTGNRAFFANAGLALLLHPEFHVNAGLRRWARDACAPLTVEPALLEPVWRRLADRAEAMGFARPAHVTTDDADVHLVADGRAIRPVAVAGGRHTFVLGDAGTELRLVSRTAIPADDAAYAGDWRSLGVAVGRIVVRGQGRVTEIPADHPGLKDGWHPPETDGATLWRWTDGNARLPVQPTSGPLVVEVHVGMSPKFRRHADGGAASDARATQGAEARRAAA